MELSDEEFEKVRLHTLKCYPEEMCGIITIDDEFVPITNIHEQPEKHFTICPRELQPYLGKLKAVIHSHTRGLTEPEIFDLRTPSFSDTLGQKKSGLPWLIVGTEGENVLRPISLPRTRNNQYLERPFVWFISDCYSLVQDFYWFELGIDLPDHKAEDDYRNVRRGDNLFDAYIEEYGFIELPLAGTELRKGDLLLLDNGGKTRNHLGIYDGEGYVLHQDMLSKKEQIEHFLYRIHKVLRYDNKSIPESE